MGSNERFDVLAIGAVDAEVIARLVGRIAMELERLRRTGDFRNCINHILSHLTIGGPFTAGERDKP